MDDAAAPSPSPGNLGRGVHIAVVAIAGVRLAVFPDLRQPLQHDAPGVDRRDHRVRRTVRDHPRGHRPFGGRSGGTDRRGVRHDARRWRQHRPRGAGCAGTGAVHRAGQRPGDRPARHTAVHRHARGVAGLPRIDAAGIGRDDDSGDARCARPGGEHLRSGHSDDVRHHAGVRRRLAVPAQLHPAWPLHVRRSAATRKRRVASASA